LNLIYICVVSNLAILEFGIFDPLYILLVENKVVKNYSEQYLFKKKNYLARIKDIIYLFTKLEQTGNND
jgi:hypothetical protein